MSNNIGHVFISYSRKDKKVVERYVEAFRKMDFIVWQDVSSIPPGEEWHKALLDAVEKSAVVVIFWSQHAFQSKYVNEEIDHAIKLGKPIIPVHLDPATELGKLTGFNAVSDTGNAAQSVATRLLQIAARLKREVTGFKPNLPMSAQTVEGEKGEPIGEHEYVVIPLIKSAYSNVEVIAAAGTILAKAKRIQVVIQNTRTKGYAVVRDSFKAILQEDKNYPEDTEPLACLFVTGALNPFDETTYEVDPRNVAHYSDMYGTLNKALAIFKENVHGIPDFQIFPQSLVEMTLLLGLQIDRWLPLQLFKWNNTEYIRVITVPPRQP